MIKATETDNTKKPPFSGECFSLFFNLIISQLFINSIGSIIELIRIFTINILTKNILSARFVKNYGIYIQPIITSTLLFIIGFAMYTLYDTIKRNNDCSFYSYIPYAGYICFFILGIVFLGCIIFFFYQMYKNKRKIFEERNNMLKQLEEKENVTSPKALTEDVNRLLHFTQKY